jgi:hypothetical protein
MLLSSSLVFAKEYKGRSGAGFKLGMKMAGLRGDDVDRYSSETSDRTGLSAGAFFKVRMGDYFSFQPEILYSQHGIVDKSGTEDITMKADVMELPLLFKVNIPTKSLVLPNFFFGPTGTWKISSGTDPESPSRAYYWDRIRDYDAGMTFGAGSEFLLNEQGSIYFDARYYIGMVKTFKFNSVKYDDTWEVYYKALTINVGYMFNL